MKFIVKYQNTVQHKLFDKTPTDPDLTTNRILDSINEMDSIASKIQSTVDSRLFLLQNKIANLQAEESATQGKNMMVFTLITAVFLPLSFLTSLFALDIESFEKAPAWVFKVIFGVSFPFAALVIYALYFHPYVMATTKPIREYTKKQYKHIKKRCSKYLKRHIKKRYSRVTDEETVPEETYLSDVSD
ncbi:hypothetical protein K445DRAFT_319265 [Daldinia sp. EC12]|nr:hypothetical protein K445DRAFT_319265 [Daldinia sp. EC12]